MGAVRHYREFLLGRDPHEIGRLWQEMYRGQYFEGGRVLTAAISAIDIALHDVVGKALGVPVYQLLGGKQREWVPCFATTGAPDLETLVKNCKLLLDKGWDVIRTGMAQRKQYDDERLFEPRESIGITLHRLDAAQPAGADLHRRDRASSGGRAQLCVARTPRDADGSGQIHGRGFVSDAVRIGGVDVEGARGAGARRGVQRRVGQGTGVQVLGSAAFAPAGWVAYELVVAILNLPPN